MRSVALSMPTTNAMIGGLGSIAKKYTFMIIGPSPSQALSPSHLHRQSQVTGSPDSLDHSALLPLLLELTVLTFCLVFEFLFFVIHADGAHRDVFEIPLHAVGALQFL